MNHAIHQQPSDDTFAQASFLDIGNAQSVEGLQARYLEDPNSVSAEWRDFFRSLGDEANDICRNANGASWEPLDWPIPLRGELISALDGNWPIEDSGNGSNGASIPAKLFAPTEQLADMDAGRAGNLGDDRVWLKAGSDEALFVFA